MGNRPDDPGRQDYSAGSRESEATDRPTRTHQASTDQPVEATADTDRGGDTSQHQSYELAPMVGGAIVQPGQLVAGRYRLDKPIGQGGMGMVWRAEQESPVKRIVALKLIKSGVDSKQVLMRFNAERQALAVMDHANIAKIFDGGMTETGMPFFVMELVDGRKITRHCDDGNYSIRDRLELFVSVCHAIHHAHQKGIIHRDIKPSNVLVSRQTGAPKVIDFGVAKATEAQRLEESLDTGAGIVGTPQYMSPEQATFDSTDVDTRSDVYSLGILLYELLTSTTPFRVDTKTSNVLELLELIRHQDPIRPSMQLHRSESDLPKIARQRQLDANQLAGRLRHELDWIVMKAIEKDRERRYESANEFAKDVQRYLDGEAIKAHPPSRRYRLGKMLKKNRGVVLATSLVLFSLIGGIIGTTYGMFEAREQANLVSLESREKELALQKESRQRKLAVAAKERAESAEIKIQETADDLSTVESFQAKQLYSVDALEMGERIKRDIRNLSENAIQHLDLEQDESARRLHELDDLMQRVNFTDVAVQTLDLNVLQPAIDAIDNELADQPLVRGRLILHLGKAYDNLGLFEKAVETQDLAYTILSEQLPPNDPMVLRSMALLAYSYESLLELDKAAAIYRQLIAVGKDNQDKDVQETVVAAMGNLSGLLYAQGKLEEAQEMQNQTLAVTGNLPDNLETARSEIVDLNNMATLASAEGRLEEAEQMLREAIERMSLLMGPEHPDTLVSVSNLGVILSDQKKLKEAEPYYVRSVEAMRRQTGDSHPITWRMRNRYGVLLWEMGRYEEAIVQFKSIVDLSADVMRPNHPKRFSYCMNLEINYRGAKRYDDCIAVLEKMLDIDFNDGQLLSIQTDLFETYLLAKKTEKADAMIKQSIARFRQNLEPDSPELASKLAFYSIAYFRLEMWEKAEPFLTECVRIRQEIAPRSWGAAYANSMMGELRFHQNDREAAEPLLLDAIKGLEEFGQDVPPERWNDCIQRLVDFYKSTDQPSKSDAWLKRKK